MFSYPLFFGVNFYIAYLVSACRTEVLREIRAEVRVQNHLVADGSFFAIGGLYGTNKCNGFDFLL